MSAKLTPRQVAHDLIDQTIGDLRVLWVAERSAGPMRYHVRCACRWAGVMPRDRIASEGRCPSCASVAQRFLASPLGRAMLDIYPADVLGSWWAHRVTAETEARIKAELRGEGAPDEPAPAPVVAVVRPTACRRCGAVLAPSPKKPRQWCSDRCRHAAARAAQSE